MWVVTKDTKTDRLEFVSITYVPALVKLFDEILVNALDNISRDSKGTTELDVKVVLAGVSSLEIEIINNGEGLPVVKHKKEKMWVPELVFGHLMTGSNFTARSEADDDAATGGQHGLGAKLANILSTSFSVETFDSKRQLRFRQDWHRNMRVAHLPVVDSPGGTGGRVASGYTKIAFTPDLSKFDLTAHGVSATAALDALQGSVRVMRRRALDASAVSGLKVTFNGEKLGLRSV